MAFTSGGLAEQGLFAKSSLVDRQADVAPRSRAPQSESMVGDDGLRALEADLANVAGKTHQGACTCKDPDRCKCKKSSFGPQSLSTRQTFPRTVFGSSLRDNSSKEYISQKHSNALGGNNSAGPIYSSRSSYGIQSDSKAVTAPRISFGTASREGRVADKATPGPGTYKPAVSAIGEQAESRRQNPPSTKIPISTRDGQAKVYSGNEDAFFGVNTPGPGAYTLTPRQPAHGKRGPRLAPGTRNAGRFRYDYLRRAASIPGAGEYGKVDSFGFQPASAKPNAPSFGFGTSKRSSMEKRYLSKQHDKCSQASASPGPTTAAQRSALGPQLTSLKQSPALHRFTIAERLGRPISTTPGPADYCV
ncbi:hypothetical protein WJX74_010744 [Apatococcus lobatus]|uniref:Uncharacterized protein n=2 Tax=Apatococcus TaxID=904362 RepID=A0AAW1T4Q8_9CHLO